MGARSAFAFAAIAALLDLSHRGAFAQPSTFGFALAPAPPPEAIDPELTRPLTPLDQFRVQAARVPDGTSKAPVDINYNVTVSGLDQLGVTGRFRELTALGKQSGHAGNLIQLRARADADAELIGRLLRAAGYFDGVADVAISPTYKSGGPVDVTLTVTPGRQYKLGDIAITGFVTQPPALARNALPLQSGDPIIATDVEAGEAQVVLALPQQGYPFASLGLRDIVLDDATHLGDYSLPVTPGPRSSFGNVTVAGNPVISARHAAGIARFRRGQLYDSRQVDDLRRALVATSLYSSVGLEPVDTKTIGPDGNEVVDVRVRGASAQTRTLSGSIGYGTGEGFTLAGQWVDRNLFPPEGALTLRGIAGTQTQLLSAGFRRSNAGQRDRTFQALAQISRDDVDGYQANTATLSARLSRDSTPIWQKRWTYSLGAEALVTNELGYDRALSARVRRTYEIAALPLQLGYDRSDSLLDPTAGFRLVARASPELSLQGGATPYFKGLLEGSAYRPLGRGVVLATRLRLGGLAGADPNDLAPSRRFYAGGGGSVRGFGYQELGPKAADNKAIGGASLVEASVEGRYRFGDLGVVGFVDGGQVYSTSLPQFTDLRFGVGVGARYYTAFGPIRLDVATPLARRPGESVISLYISIGQAF
jgi:translocation and assembly module TamA